MSRKAERRLQALGYLSLIIGVAMLAAFARALSSLWPASQVLLSEVVMSAIFLSLIGGGVLVGRAHTRHGLQDFSWPLFLGLGLLIGGSMMLAVTAAGALYGSHRGQVLVGAVVAALFTALLVSGIALIRKARSALGLSPPRPPASHPPVTSSGERLVGGHRPTNIW